MDWNNQNVRLTAAVIGGIIIGFVAHWLIARPAEVADPEVLVQEETSNVGLNGVLALDQAAGSSVVIERVVLENVGWVAIHDDVNGMPGRILGAQLFDKGTHAGVVDLLRKTVPGTHYFVVIHTDDGNYKNFNPKLDIILNDEAGRPTMSSFTTTNSAATSSVSITI